MEMIFAPETRPFAVAAAILFGLIGIELAALIIGVSLSELIEKSLHMDGGTGFLGWLNVGGVPLLVFLMLALGAFAAAGFALQGLAASLFAPLPAWMASAGALVLAVPAVRGGSRLVTRIIPQDETYAVEQTDFVGLTARVVVGPLDAGLPGQVKVKDPHGNWHRLRARAAPGAEAMAAGSPVLLVDLKDGIFLAIPAPGDLGA